MRARGKMHHGIDTRERMTPAIKLREIARHDRVAPRSALLGVPNDGTRLKAARCGK